MKTLWLTYCWKDNEDCDVDHIIAELRARNLEVRFDRAQLLAGRRLWEQIDQAINDQSVDAWAMHVTENSLKSEPCQEEIAYALDRTLRTRGTSFPLIGIFSSKIDRELIPSALATRLYVNLTDPDWATHIVDALNGAKSPIPTAPPTPFGHRIYQQGDSHVIEVWPRSGRWYPFVAVVPASEAANFKYAAQAPKGGQFYGGMIQGGEASSPDKSWQGKSLMHNIDLSNTAHLHFSKLPSAILFGQDGQPLHKLQPNCQTFQLSLQGLTF